ncbi:MAG: TlpA family protein disulfide reductase [Myxococcales bacterium]|nr:MAG: TlpA family protein disulfide reductase [Myxococcales bacterium]
MKRQNALWAASVVSVVLGLGLFSLLGVSFADGEMRRRQTPLEAIFGEEVVAKFEAGESTELHYLGDSRVAPDFALHDQYGKLWRLSDQRGKAVILNFWTITCQPCLQEMPSLVTLAEIAEGRDDIEVVSVSTDANWSAVRGVFPVNSRLRVLFDPKKKVVEDKYGTRLYPETWIIDPKGVIRARFDGARDWASPITLDLVESFM